MARVKRCSGTKGMKTVIRADPSGRVFYLITNQGVTLVRQPATAATKRSRDRTDDGPSRQRARSSGSGERENLAQNEFYTKKVVARRWSDGHWVYKVEWRGYPKATWEPVESLLQHDGVMNKHLAEFLTSKGARIDDAAPHQRRTPLK